MIDVTGMFPLSLNLLFSLRKESDKEKKCLVYKYRYCFLKCIHYSHESFLEKNSALKVGKCYTLYLPTGSTMHINTVKVLRNPGTKNNNK